jgi:hypothetical protein
MHGLHFLHLDGEFHIVKMKIIDLKNASCKIGTKLVTGKRF